MTEEPKADGPPDLEPAEPPPAESTPEPARDVETTAEDLAAETPDEPVGREPQRERTSGWPGLIDAVGSIRESGARIEKLLGELQGRFDREVRAEATREKVIDRLHAELQEYKSDLLLSTLRPVFVDLIQLHDDIGKVADPPADDEEGADQARRYVELLQGFRQGIEDILYRQGVEPFEVEGDDFDPRRQRAVATVPTDDAARNRTIAARHRKGFRAGDRVIRAEVVSVYAVRR